MAYQTLQATIDVRGVLTVSLNRPDVRNAFNAVVIKELSRVFEKEGLDDRVRAVVLRGNGPVFCAGGDLNWMQDSVNFTFEENLQDTRTLAQMFAQLNEFPKPVIGVVQGAAIGGGVGLVSICDIAIAATDAVFSLSEVRLGIIPACIGPFVVAKIGASHARALFVSAERFSAARAREVGLVHDVVAASELDSAVERVIGNILQCGPEAMAAAKKLVLNLTWPEYRARKKDPLEYVAKVLADLRISPEGQEGVRAFLEKRKPNWLSK
ncbi:MAG: enoyl-CoA hydratase-related protein [Bacteriovoracia bacterium]